MKPFLTSAAIAALILLGGCAETPVASNAQQVAAATGDSAEVEVTCRNVVKTGTRIGTRVCKTDRQWEEESTDSRDAVNSIQRNSAQSAGPSGG